MKQKLAYSVIIYLMICLGCRESPKSDIQNPSTSIQESSATMGSNPTVPDSLKSLIVNGEILHYLDKGEGDPLIFVHGTISDYRTWTSYYNRYAQDYRVIDYSRRYAWPNRQVYDSTADYSIHIHAQDLEDLINKLGLKNVILVGHSYGAFTSLGYALENPENVRALILGEPPMSFLAKNSSSIDSAYSNFRVNTIAPAAQLFKEGKDANGLEFFISGVNNTPNFKLSDLPDSEKVIWMDNILELKGHAIGGVYGNLDQTQLASLKVPTLIIIGDQSPMWLTGFSHELHKLLPYSTLDTLIGSSHGLYFQQPEQANNAIQVFLNGL